MSHEVVLSNASDVEARPLTELKKTQTELLNKLKILNQQKSMIQNQLKFVEQYTENALYGTKKNSKSEPAISDVPTNSTVIEASSILEFNMLQMTALYTKLNGVDDEVLKLNDDISITNADIAKYKKSSNENTISESYLITILVDVTNMSNENNNNIDIQMTYVVSDATWSPSYDIRVSTIENTLNAMYYAEIIQQSGENWSDCNIYLSTSNPAIGSAPPVLPSKVVDWSWKVQSRMQKLNRVQSLSKSGKSGLPSKNMKARRLSDGMSKSHYDENEDDERNEQMQMPMYQNAMILETLTPSAPPMGYGGGGGGDTSVLTSNLIGSGDAGSTTFTIQRKVTIESDSKPHKVTIMSEVFQPQMLHYIAPNMEASAYLQTKTVNTSKFPLLASSKVSIFLDGNFISTSSIKQTNSGESFNIFLGVDPSIKVEYLPCRSSTKVKGWLGGTEVKKYDYCTIVHNTKQIVSRVIVAEVLPRAVDEKILVELVEPAPHLLTKPNENAPIASSEQDIIASLDALSVNIDDVASQRGGGSGAMAPTSPVWPTDFITQNKATNNIVWWKTVGAGEKVAFKFSYRICWPQGQSVDIM